MDVVQSLYEEAQKPIVEISPRTGKPKRRKAARACVHCKRLHLTCDNSRPCTRCVARGRGDTCIDCPRKERHVGYLDDRSSTENAEEASVSGKRKRDSFEHSSPKILRDKGQNRKFESSALDLEYHALSSLIDVPTSSPSNSEASGAEGFHESFSRDSMSGLEDLSEILATATNNWPSPLDNPWSGEKPLSGSRSVTIVNNSTNRYGTISGLNPQYGLDMSGEVFDPLLTIPMPAQPQKKSIWPARGKTHTGLRGATTAEIYRNVRTPFPYTPGFHALTRYLRARFTREKLLIMAESMSKYRPSFIACTSTLTEDDLVFMELCFQRTLLEYSKYIAKIGTPTLVWRRTGQIAACGKEFSVLTGWSKEQLVDGGMFVAEVMDDDSVVRYFEMFSEIAFGDSRGVTVNTCTLVSPTGKRVNTAAIWTVRHDVFGIPMMIIGNFLPVLR